MALTGVQLSVLLDIKTDRAFSAYFNPDKNDLLKEALYKAVEMAYATLDTQKIYDQLFKLIKNASYTPVSNQLNLLTSVTDYLHELAVQTRYTETIQTTVTAATSATPIIITLDTRTNLRNEEVDFTSAAGNTAINGTRYLKKLTDYTFALYQDAKLTIPISGNGTYTGGAVVKRVVRKYAKMLPPQRKIDVFSRGTIYDPKYSINNGVMQLYPTTETCTSINLDYIIIPPVLIDYQDNLVDLELTYPLRFLYTVMSECALLMGFSSRDMLLAQNSTTEIIQQP